MSERRVALSIRSDWNEIRRLYVAGMTQQQVADRLGIDSSTVHRVLNREAREKHSDDSRARRYIHTCADCGKPSTGSYCKACAARRQTTSVRDGELRCIRCRQWYPDEKFSQDRQLAARRFKQARCRLCQAEIYQEKKERKKGEMRHVDWDQVKRLYVSGMTYKQVAEKMGVSYKTVASICNPDTREQNRLSARKRFMNNTCIDCGGECSKQSTRCQKCAGSYRVSTVRVDSLRCSICREWKPDEAFSRNSRRPQRRFHSYTCRDCSSKERREYRNGTHVLDEATNHGGNVPVEA